MLDASYWALIERRAGGAFSGRIPDLPEIPPVTGRTEQEVIQSLSQAVRQCARSSVLDGKPLPAPRPVNQQPPAGEAAHLRRILLIFGQ